MTLVLVDLDACPDCGAPTRHAGWSQPSLFRFGGYGETTHTVELECTRRGCPWYLEVARLSLPPDRRTA